MGARVADEQDFDAYVVHRSGRLLRTAYLLTRDWAAAEDLLQMTLVKAWRAWSRLHQEPDAFVRTIMVNTYRSWWRRRRFHEVPLEALIEHPRRGDGTGAVDDRDALWMALGRLPRRQRVVVVLRFFEDLTEAETAQVMGCSLGTVKSQTSRALAKLRIDPSITVLSTASGEVPTAQPNPTRS